jgi:hypothetical protein
VIEIGLPETADIRDPRGIAFDSRIGDLELFFYRVKGDA